MFSFTWLIENWTTFVVSFKMIHHNYTNLPGIFFFHLVKFYDLLCDIQTRHSLVVPQRCEETLSAWCWEVLHSRVSPTSGNSAVCCATCSAWTQTQTHWSLSRPEYCTQPTNYHMFKEKQPSTPFFAPFFLVPSLLPYPINPVFATFTTFIAIEETVWTLRAVFSQPPWPR